MEVKSKIKTKLYFDDMERQRFSVWCIRNNMTKRSVAAQLCLSESYFCLIYKGKRPLTDEIIKKLSLLGYKI